MSTCRSYLFTSESVTEGHPDKLADQISDAVLDEALARDDQSRVACETLVSHNLIVIAGEISSKAYLDFFRLSEKAEKVGYGSQKTGFDLSRCFSNA